MNKQMDNQTMTEEAWKDSIITVGTRMFANK